jgi:hypothetical protein
VCMGGADRYEQGLDQEGSGFSIQDRALLKGPSETGRQAMDPILV